MRLLCLAVLGCLLLAFQPVKGASSKTKILLIWTKHDHPPGTHMYREVCELLAERLKKVSDVETVLSEGWPNDPAVLEGVKTVVMYTNPGGTLLLDQKNRESALKLLKSGVGFTAIHWSTGASPETGPEYQQILGAWFNRPLFSTLKITTTTLEQVDTKHPICRGWASYELKDEYYMDLRFIPEAKPILKVRIDDKYYVVAWTYDRADSNRGRSFGTVVGHFHDNFQIEAFRKMLLNGILWTARLRVPRNGASG